MKLQNLFIAVLVWTVMASPIAECKDKKKHSPRGMIESMQSVPCGVKERGLTGVGSIFGSVGVSHVNSNEKLCPQYLLRTDEMEYHIRPLDQKHAVLLPVGKEAEYKIKKDRLFLRVADEDNKARPYQVVSAEQLSSTGKSENTAYRPTTPPAPVPTSTTPAAASHPAEPRVAEKQTDRGFDQSVPPPQ